MLQESEVFVYYFDVLILLLSVRIFHSCVVGHECFFKCWAIYINKSIIICTLHYIVNLTPIKKKILHFGQEVKAHSTIAVTLKLTPNKKIIL